MMSFMGRPLPGEHHVGRRRAPMAAAAGAAKLRVGARGELLGSKWPGWFGAGEEKPPA